MIPLFLSENDMNKFTSQHETQKNCVLSFLCSSTEMFSFLDGWKGHQKGTPHPLLLHPFSCSTTSEGKQLPFLVFANKVHPSVTMSTTTTTMLVH